MLRGRPETSQRPLSDYCGEKAGLRVRESEHCVWSFASHMCLCMCMFICVCIQCMCCVWVMGLSHRTKHSSPHGHNGTAPAHQTLNIAEFNVQAWPCVYLNRECQWALGEDHVVLFNVTNMFIFGDTQCSQITFD